MPKKLEESGYGALRRLNARNLSVYPKKVGGHLRAGLFFAETFKSFIPRSPPPENSKNFFGIPAAPPRAGLYWNGGAQWTYISEKQ